MRISDWSSDVCSSDLAGILCTGETYKAVVKMTFAKGASLEDPSGLFNASLEGNTRRAIDFHEGDKIDEEALKALLRAAVALHTARVRSGQAPHERESGMLGMRVTLSVYHGGRGSITK